MLGVCYYPEHWPEDFWAEDARRMREMGLATFASANSHGSASNRDAGSSRGIGWTGR